MSDTSSGETLEEPTVDVAREALPPVDPMRSRFSRYAVLEEIGRGGMGRVLRAYDPKLQREVALDEVRGDSLDESATQRLVAEARAMAKLSHPNVVSVYDVDEGEGGEVVLVMEYVPGQTLRQWLRERDRGWQEVKRALLD